MILTREQIDPMTEAECRQALVQLAQDHRLDTPISELTKEEWAQVDDVGNTLLWLEDRIQRIKMTELGQQANLARWGKDRNQSSDE